MRRLAFFNSSKSWGGGEKWHMETALHFAARPDYEIFVFGSPRSELKKRLVPHPQIHYIDFTVTNRSFLNPIKINHLRSLFNKLQLDILIVNGSADMKIAAYAGRLAGIKRVIYRRGSAIPIKNSAVNRYLFKNCISDVLANSQETKRTINMCFSSMFPLEKIKVIYNPIDTVAFKEKHNTKKQNEYIVIGNLARLVPQKNQSFLIDLSRELSLRNIKHKILVGGTGPLAEELKKYNKQMKTEQNVYFKGFISDLDSFFNQIDIFLLSSKWEGFGYVLAEAALYRKPSIAFDISSNKELIEHGRTGYLVPYGDIDQTIDNILRLSEKRKRDTFGNAGYELVLNRFDQKVIYPQLEEFLS